MKLLDDLPDDILEDIIVYLFRQNKLASALNFARVSKHILERFREVVNFQCRDISDIYIWNFTHKTPLRDAITEGKLNVVKWFYSLYNSDQNWLQSSSIELAYSNNQIDILKWIYEIDEKLFLNDIEIIKNMISCVISEGYFDCLKWLYNIHIFDIYNLKI